MLKNNGIRNFRSPPKNKGTPPVNDKLITENNYNLVQENGSFILA
jgi:hypothetical protein